MCYAESIASTVISKNKDKIEEANKNVISNLNTYIDGLQGELDGVSSALRDSQELIGSGLGDSLGNFGNDASVVSNNMSGALEMMPDISSGLGAALDFANIVMNVFAGELPPKQAINDYYQLATGGSGAAASELPSMGSIGDSVVQSGTARAERMTTPPSAPDFATPRKSEPDVDLDPGDLSKPMTKEEKEAALTIA